MILNYTWVYFACSSYIEMISASSAAFRDFIDFFTLLENWFPLGELTISKLTLYEVG